jgi:hypothetical protein
MSAVADLLIETIISDVLIPTDRVKEAKQGIKDRADGAGLNFPMLMKAAQALHADKVQKERGDAEDLLDYLPQK